MQEKNGGSQYENSEINENDRLIQHINNIHQLSVSQDPPKTKKVSSLSPLEKKKIIKHLIPKKKKVDFTEVLNRMALYTAKNKIQIEEKKKEFIGKENILKNPEINENSKRMVHNTEDFYTRVTRFKEQVQKKNEELLKKAEDKKALEVENSLVLKIKKIDKSEIENKIESLYNWEEKRKLKINDLRSMKEKNNQKEFKFVPQINKKENNKSSDIQEGRACFTDRLYKEDIERRNDHIKKLAMVYKNSFRPQTNRVTKLKKNNLVETINNCLENDNDTIRHNVVNTNIDYNFKDEGIYVERIQDEELEDILRNKVKKNLNRK